MLCPRAGAVTTSTAIPPGIVDRDDSLFPLGSGPLYLGGTPLPCRRATLAACRPSSWCGKVRRLFGLGGTATK